MPRFPFALLLCASVPYGAAVFGTGAQAQDGELSHSELSHSELSRCLDASTILGAGGDVSDQELAAAQSACKRFKQSPPDKGTLARVNAALDTIAREAARRGR